MIALSLFSIIAHEVVTEKEDRFDSIIFNFLSTHSSPFIVQLAKSFTFFGSGIFLSAAYAIFMIFLVYKHRMTDVIDVLLLAVTSTILIFLLKMGFSRQRPEKPMLAALNSYSFPSGHALSSLVFFSLLAWENWKSRVAIKWKLIVTVCCILLSLAVGISRIVLRYHYASDVLAGFSMGLAYVLLFFLLKKK